MEKQFEAVFFDLFFTLVEPLETSRTEWQYLRISREEWEHSAEASELYIERATGQLASSLEMIEAILARLKLPTSPRLVEDVLSIRQQRMAGTLRMLEPDVIDVLLEMKKRGLKLGVISNADMIDIDSWSSSYLAELIDSTVFSCNYRVMKPEPAIYHAELSELDVSAEKSLFVGDGGDEELTGAKKVGMTTVRLSRFLDRGDLKQSSFVDCHVSSFQELLKLV